MLVVTKDALNAGSTQWAQGGIAAALGPEDTPEEHEADTLVAGAGACDRDAVRVLVTEGPEAVRELIALGTNFDHDDDGELSLTREGGHHRDRIAHAGGDATGAEIQRALIAAIETAPDIEVIQHALAVDLLLGPDGGVAGLTLHVIGEGAATASARSTAAQSCSPAAGSARCSRDHHPAVSTGDGMALALRAGATLRDLEFVQFHPTVMYLGPDSRGQQPLISEAVRGEGAFLVDDEGDRFMQGVHELADLAPRDVVAKAIMQRMIETGRPHMWLDARHLGAEFWERRFPTILATTRSHGVDPVTELIPVAPACHYASGGVRTDLGAAPTCPGSTPPVRSPVPASTAPTGWPPTRCSRDWSSRAGSPPCCRASAAGPNPRPTATPGWSGAVRRDLQETMTSQVGVLRIATGLAEATATARQAGRATPPSRSTRTPGRPPTC